MLSLCLWIAFTILATLGICLEWRGNNWGRWSLVLNLLYVLGVAEYLHAWQADHGIGFWFIAILLQFMVAGWRNLAWYLPTILFSALFAILTLLVGHEPYQWLMYLIPLSASFWAYWSGCDRVMIR